jgi:hypothetical protein
MSEFVWLRKGDKLPAVGVAQMLLNRTGASLTVDGDFGTRTQSAVRGFQSPRGLASDGVIGRQTWPRLVANDWFPIIDCIDVFDSSLFNMEVQDIRRAGGSPILIGGMCNGIEQAVQQVKSAVRDAFLVRFHGHGAPGAAGASDGHGTIEDNSTFRNNAETRLVLNKLQGSFGRCGCIQFMHCNTAQGRMGREFLQMVAVTTGVPATAGVQTQYAGSLRKTLRFEGSTRTFCPRNADLKTWGRGLPILPGMSVR